MSNHDKLTQAEKEFIDLLPLPDCHGDDGRRQRHRELRSHRPLGTSQPDVPRNNGQSDDPSHHCP